jgi:hypothetical protein
MDEMNCIQEENAKLLEKKSWNISESFRDHNSYAFEKYLIAGHFYFVLVSIIHLTISEFIRDRPYD